MIILVAYASKHGATKEIAERIAKRLTAASVQVELSPLDGLRNLSGYDAFVIGSAVYFGKWIKEADSFVRSHHNELSERPVWLFSSGPLGTETVDAAGVDVREQAEPKEIPEFRELLNPVDHHIFFGALSAANFGFTERVIRALPAGKELLKEGDFRDWDEIDRWADSITKVLEFSVAAAD